MHIVFLDFDDIKNPLLNAGQARATYEVGKALVKRGHKVTVISSRYPGSKARVQNGITYKHIGLGTKHIRLNNFAYILNIPVALIGLDADIIIECFTAPISTMLTPLWTNTPVVGLPASFEAERFSKKYHLPLYLIEKYGSKLYKYFLPFSKAVDNKMKKMNPHIISKIVPEGVGEEYFRLKRAKPKHILFLGRMDIDQKGIDLLLHAYKKVADKLKYPLIVAGNGPDEEKVKKMINELGLEKKVRMTGATYGRKKMKILSESLFVAFTSRHETFSCFALEALASGLPLAAFDIPGISWTDKKSAFKAKPFDTDEYARLLYKLSTDKNIDQKSNFARQFAGKYTWENVALQFEQFFYDIDLKTKLVSFPAITLKGAKSGRSRKKYEK